MYDVSAQGVDERIINIHYYPYYYATAASSFKSYLKKLSLKKIVSFSFVARRHGNANNRNRISEQFSFRICHCLPVSLLHRNSGLSRKLAHSL